MLLIALEGSTGKTVEHAAAYLRETYGFIVLTREAITQGGTAEASYGLETFLKAFTQSRHRKVTTREEARQIGQQLRYKPNAKGRPTAVPLGFEYYEDHAGIIVCSVDDENVLRKVRENDGALWFIWDGPAENWLRFLRTGDKLILHNSSLERLNTGLSLALGGESIVNTIDDTPDASGVSAGRSIVDQIKGKD